MSLLFAATALFSSVSGIAPPPANGDLSASDPYNPLDAVDWEKINLRAQINPKFFSGGYDKPSGSDAGVQGITFRQQGINFEVRRLDAEGNNLQNTAWGTTNSQAVRCVPSQYADGLNEPNGESRMNPREISNVIAKQTPEEDPKFANNRGLTQFAWQWGQFIDHDVTLISEATMTEQDLIGAETEHISVYVPCNDPFYDENQADPQWCDADREIEIVRTHIFPGTGPGTNKPREVINEITSFVDGSMIYGSDLARADNLRKNEKGFLLLADDEFFNGFLPANTFTEENEPNAESSFVLAGDVRPNEQLGLLAMHNIWVRFHNLVAAEVADAISLTPPGQPALTPAQHDEAVYQYTKLIVTAIVQKITYQDWLPTMFGPTAIRQFLGEYKGYNNTVNGGACLIFSDAAYRLGHTFLPNFLPLRNQDCSVWSNIGQCSACNATIGGIELKNAFFVPDVARLDGFYEALFRGYACTLANEVDVSITGAVRNFLFLSAVGSDGNRLFGDLDLITLNLQRAREHGLPDFNTVRGMIGLGKLANFNELSSDSELNSNFEEIYHDINDMDLFLPLLAEDHFPDGSFGMTISKIVLEQFARFRDGDRFWYQDYIKPGELMDFINSVTLKSVVELTTGINNVDTLDSIRHNIFQNSRAIPIFQDVNSFPKDRFFAHAAKENVEDAGVAAPLPPQEPLHHHRNNHYRPGKDYRPFGQQPADPQDKKPLSFPGTNGTYVIQLTNMQIFVVFAGLIGLILCSLFMVQQCRKNGQNRYRPVKYETESEFDASDREKLQS